MEVLHTCESCNRPLPGGQYCAYCVDGNGQLQSFEERFQRMTAWLISHHPTLSQTEAERRTREKMKTLPAWKDHPALKV